MANVQEVPTAALAASGAIYQFVVSMGVPTQVALPVVLAAVLGAAMAVRAEEKPELSVRVVFWLVVSFLVSVFLGLWGGPFASALVLALVGKLVTIAWPAWGLDPLGSLVVALTGQKYLLPMILKLADRKAGGA